MARTRRGLAGGQQRNGFRNTSQKAQANCLRRTMSPVERILWHHPRARRFLGLSVRRQAPVAPFIVDFLFPAASSSKPTVPATAPAATGTATSGSRPVASGPALAEPRRPRTVPAAASSSPQGL
ncbi:endonuclease domain-containing protein [Tabrizicola sp.]|uniref:endonuclease domain-containing protein n=1 Tax=Tabrizicola sp. TaxID=2005166 RepID=UPI003BB14C09